MIGRHHVPGSASTPLDSAAAWIAKIRSAVATAVRGLGLRLSNVGSALSNALGYWSRRRLLDGLPVHPIFNVTPERLYRATKVLLFPEKIYQLWRLDFLRSYIGHRKHPDRFYFFSYDYYLSKNFSLRQRISSAVSHYRYESRSCGPAYHRAVYHSPEGLILWHRNINGTRYALSLRATEEVRHEGDLSILCMVDDVHVSRLCFTYVRGEVFGIDEPMTLLVTRNQTERNTELLRFRADFKQNSPPYFCVAAVCGIAMAHGIRRICLIHEEAQIAYEPRYAQSFKNSYSALWQAFGAKEMDAHAAFSMAVPPELSSLATVKHKARAGARRQNWLEIMINAREACLAHRVTRLPSPIDMDTSLLLRTAAPRDEAGANQLRLNEIERPRLDS